MRIDSVPPEVIAPPPPSGRCTSAPTPSITSRSSAASSDELERVQRVAEQVPAVHLLEQRLEVGPTARVDEAEQAGAVHRRLARLALLEVGQDLVGGDSAFSHGSSS